MIPYGDFSYFGLLLYPVFGALVLGLCGRSSPRWLLVATLGMLVAQYAGSWCDMPWWAVRELWMVAAYACFQCAVARGFLWLRTRSVGGAAFASALALALTPLALTKFLSVLAADSRWGFLGISYVTFRSIDVILGIQDRLITSLPPAQLFAYLFFFPTISAGPIDRYRRFETDWKRRRSRAEFLSDLDGAVDRIFRGCLYKFVLAFLVKQYWLDAAARGTGVLNMASYMYAYCLYLFFDFAGYSAFAVGVSRVFGIHTPENFDRPFLAGNIREFWERWHISLSAWFRDHVYTRFVWAVRKRGWIENKQAASATGVFLSMSLMGIWHGTAWHYLLYGVYHAVLITAHEFWVRWNKRQRLWGTGPLWRAAGVLATFHAVSFGFLVFSGRLGGVGAG